MGIPLAVFINIYRELCSVHKPGGLPIPATLILTASKLAATRANELHTQLAAELQALEDRVLEERVQKLEQMRKHREALSALQPSSAGAMDIDGGAKAIQGIDRDDPILAWGNLYTPNHHASATAGDT
jgi:hypothetical protein